MGQGATILVVEDEQGAREAMARVLRMEGYEVLSAGNVVQAMEYVTEPVDLVISDVRMESTKDGLELLKKWKERRRETPFIMATAYGEVESAVAAMKFGAEDYLTKPINPDELLIVIKKCLDASLTQRTLEHLQERLDERLGFEQIIGNSKAMLDVFERARRAAKTDCTVLITGESGTGKELIAEALHQNSPRKSQPFVAVNMAAVPESLVESELFGHVKGAFTGATESRIGRFEAANGGTIFIDEVGDFALSSQAKLLRVLETRVINPIGRNDDRLVDVRVVAATSRDLEQMVADETFREDLYYRLNVVSIHLPPLRQRRDDIPLLTTAFLKRMCESHGREPMKLDPELVRFLESYDWPGNVRQLRNCIESMVVMSGGDVLTIADLPMSIRRSHTAANADIQIPVDRTLEEIERSAIMHALEHYDGNRTRAAESLGISVRTLQRRLKDWVDEPLSTS